MAIAPNRSPKRMGIPAHKIQNSLAAGPAVPPKDLMNITTDAGLHIRVARKKHISINFAIHLGKESGELSAKANPAKSIIHPGHDNMTAIRFICLKSWTACAIILIVSCLTIDYAGLYILPHGRIYERLQAGSIALGAHVRQCHSEPEDCKGLEHNQEMRFLDPRVHDTATRQGAAERSARLLIVRQHLVQQQRPPPFAPPTPIL